MWQDANQVNRWWCLEMPAPQRIQGAAGDYWLRWVPAPITA